MSTHTECRNCGQDYDIADNSTCPRCSIIITDEMLAALEVDSRDARVAELETELIELRKLKEVAFQWLVEGPNFCQDEEDLVSLLREMSGIEEEDRDEDD